MARSGAPRRGDVTKGIIRDTIQEVTGARAALKARLASLQDARRTRTARSTASGAKRGRGMPKRGDIKKRIGEEVVKAPVKKLIKSAGKLLSSRARQPVLGASLDVRRVDVPAFKPGTANEPHEPVPKLSVTQAPESGTVDVPREPVLEVTVTRALERGTVDEPPEQAAEPVLDLVAQSSDAPPPTLSEAFDNSLKASRFPTKKDPIVKQWAKVDMSRALEHNGSILFKDEEGNWIVKCCDSSDTVVVPLILPSVRVPILL